MPPSSDVASPRGWLLDTNIISELRKGTRADAGVRRWSQGIPPATCYISAIVVAEIRLGIERVVDHKRSAPNSMTGCATMSGPGSATGSSPSTRPSSSLGGAWPATRRSPDTSTRNDALIAATAIVHELGVVTRNIDDFERSGVDIIDPWRPKVA